MLRWLSKALGGAATPKPDGQTVSFLEHGPLTGPVYVVGDVHGCHALYRRLEAQILRDANTLTGSPGIVLLGDVVDRGPETADMLDLLTDRPPTGATRLCLRGNHEDMMLNFLNNPTMTSSWLDFGGFETLMSYGLALDMETAPSPRRLQQMLQAHIPQAHRDFLEHLPYGMQVGPYALVHAAIDVAAPLDRQPRQTVLWGDPVDAGPHDVTVIHGHTIVPQPIIEEGRIALDTGAYDTGVLTAVRLHPDMPPKILQCHA
ncbi:metallophosphoesterase [Roseicitreum antarcticum]|uniref:Serine/threonine protein phosphatase 1 n=1 Tax=Roseicitreum antarcticum TaxID=564137 RepID=A0A1H2R8J6_9RHOB|nr:metallophosphoesterase [Roseicitreum antarcticum]SDW15154.1 serine/threonine protein phosphatase 1 [Roseicitreum antarcticum]